MIERLAGLDAEEDELLILAKKAIPSIRERLFRQSEFSDLSWLNQNWIE